MRKEFRATEVDVTAEGKTRKDGKQLIEIVEKTAENLKLSAKAKQYASNVIHTLVEAEAKLHGHHLADAHLHEVGFVDPPPLKSSVPQLPWKTSASLTLKSLRHRSPLAEDYSSSHTAQFQVHLRRRWLFFNQKSFPLKGGQLNRAIGYSHGSGNNS